MTRELNRKKTKIKAIEKRDYLITVLHGILEEMFKVHPLHNLNGSTFRKYWIIMVFYI